MHEAFHCGMEHCFLKSFLPVFKTAQVAALKLHHDKGMHPGYAQVNGDQVDAEQQMQWKRIVEEKA